MPCSDSRMGAEDRQYVNGVDPAPYEYKIDILTTKNQLLEAGLCALISELEKEGIADRLIKSASEKGLVDLATFWQQHSYKDVVRLTKELDKYSEHEKELLKHILNEE